MNFRNRFALPAAFLFAALALTGCQQGTHPAAEAMTKAASPAVPQAVAAAGGAPSGVSAAAVKSIHSPGVVATDEQLAAGQCSAEVVDAATGEYLPDPDCTPGVM